MKSIIKTLTLTLTALATLPAFGMLRAFSPMMRRTMQSPMRLIKRTQTQQTHADLHHRISLLENRTMFHENLYNVARAEAKRLLEQNSKLQRDMQFWKSLGAVTCTGLGIVTSSALYFSNKNQTTNLFKN